MIVYDHNFNTNEWFVIIALSIGIVTVVLLPKRFHRRVSAVFFMTGVFSGFVFDHSLSVQPISFYDVNDVSKFEVFDFISYWMYGAMSYMFFHFYDRFEMNAGWSALYVLGWALIGAGVEWFAGMMGLFHYQHGFKIYYSFIIYLIVNCFWLALYFRFKRKGFLG